jgi:hypothetical protein
MLFWRSGSGRVFLLGFGFNAKQASYSNFAQPSRRQVTLAKARRQGAWRHTSDTKLHGLLACRDNDRSHSQRRCAARVRHYDACHRDEHRWDAEMTSRTAGIGMNTANDTATPKKLQLNKNSAMHRG